LGIRYVNLDKVTRGLMIAEIEAGPLYQSPRLNEDGLRRWPGLLKEAAQSHDDDWLAQELIALRLFKLREQYTPRNGRPTWRNINVESSAVMLAEGEFNRFYLRGLCLRAKQDGITHLKVYRGKQVSEPRPESQAKIGTLIEASTLLDVLRKEDFVSMEQSFFAIPSGPNSGLTAQLLRA
jgi:hypothetical protein